MCTECVKGVRACTSSACLLQSRYQLLETVKISDFDGWAHNLAWHHECTNVTDNSAQPASKFFNCRAWSAVILFGVSFVNIFRMSILRVKFTAKITEITISNVKAMGVFFLHRATEHGLHLFRAIERRHCSKFQLDTDATRRSVVAHSPRRWPKCFGRAHLDPNIPFELEACQET